MRSFFQPTGLPNVLSLFNRPQTADKRALVWAKEAAKTLARELPDAPIGTLLRLHKVPAHDRVPAHRAFAHLFQKTLNQELASKGLNRRIVGVELAQDGNTPRGRGLDGKNLLLLGTVVVQGYLLQQIRSGTTGTGLLAIPPDEGTLLPARIVPCPTESDRDRFSLTISLPNEASLHGRSSQIQNALRLAMSNPKFEAFDVSMAGGKTPVLQLSIPAGHPGAHAALVTALESMGLMNLE